MENGIVHCPILIERQMNVSNMNRVYLATHVVQRDVALIDYLSVLRSLFCMISFIEVRTFAKRIKDLRTKVLRVTTEFSIVLVVALNTSHTSHLQFGPSS